MNATLTRYGTALRVYDNGGKTFDRYTILPPRWAGEDYRERVRGSWVAIGASESPFHPQGFGQHTSAMPGPHLGKRIKWADLPADVQSFARQSFPAFAPALPSLELNITSLVREIGGCARNYSASQAELGPDAGRITWNAAKDDALALFGDQFDRETFDDYFRHWGAWSDEELAAHSDEESAALMLQFIAGDMRECDMPERPRATWWREYEKGCERGTYAGRIMRGAKRGTVFYYIGE